MRILSIFFIISTLFFSHYLLEKYIFSRDIKSFITTPPAPSPSLFRLSGMGNDGAVAMGIWLELLPYIGELLLRKEFAARADWNYIAGSVESVTRIDPYFYDAYLVAVTLLDQNPLYLDLSLKLGEKGTNFLPERWDIPFFTGYNYLHYKKDRNMALHFLKLSCQRPRVPSYVPGLVGTLLYEKGDYNDMKKFYENLLKGSSYPEIFRKIFELELENINNLIILENALQNFLKSYGRIPFSLDELVEKGFIDFIPQEPFGGKYYIDGREKRIKTTSEFRGYLRK